MNAKIAWAVMAAMALVSCSEDPQEESTVCNEGTRVLALGTKWASDGGTSSLDMIGCGKVQAYEPSKGMPRSDAALDLAGGNVYLLDRGAGTVTGFIGSDISKPFLDQNLSSEANPYGVGRLGDHLWVARYGSTHLLGIPFGSAKPDSIDLSSYADASTSLPRMMAVKAWNGKLVVPVQRLDKNWTAIDSSLVLVIDPASRKVEKRIALPFNNPEGVDLRGDLLALACLGGYGTKPDAGLVVVDLAKGVVSVAISGDSLGGDPARVAFTSGDRVWAAVMQAKHPNYKATPVDLTARKVGASFDGAGAVGDVVFDGASLWVANHDDASPKVFRVDPATGAMTGEFATRLAPGRLLVLP
ncbi:MAG: hypothetical protein IPK50_07455 [Fibrobacterota bacterium]|nr:hypothetical protein [Fibrobacterota bacterium]QQS06729.1 MAG: hypothetical protein IPK50_07455 [Fibrobacterota bacterium]